MKLCSILMLFIAVSCSGIAGAADVRFETGMGNITLRLYEDKAPITTDNFIRYVTDGFYDNTIFHRVIKNFVIQAGGLDTNMAGKTTRDPIVNESSNGLSNKKYTVAMARTDSGPDTATSHFYINTADNLHLDKKYASDGWGYAVFGEVIEGKDVVDAINAVKTTTVGYYENIPESQIVINKAILIDPASVCTYVGDTLDINVFCAEYQGVRWRFMLNFASIDGDPYWKMNRSTFKTADNTEGNCTAVGNDLKLPIPCTRYQGTAYQFGMNYIPVVSDPAGIYWEIDINTFEPY